MPDIWMDVDTALAEVPVNIMPLIDSTDFVTREVAIAYDAAGMDLVWNFVTTGGAYTQTAVTPTTAGNYDWAHQGDGMYSIEIPASGGASINNDTEGFGWFTGVVTGVLPWRGPTIGFRAAALNNSLIDGTTIDVNVTAISGDTTSADNLESYTDGTTPIPANVTQISGDATSADNLESYTDGTTPAPVNVTQLSGDATAADNAESFFDGTGYAGTNNVIPTVSSVTAIATGGITAGSIAADAIGASELAADAAAEIADAVWDEAASGHTTSGTYGQALNIVRANTAQAGASTTITLDASASAVDDFYNNTIIFITGGTGVGQSRIISDYVGSTKVATVSAWATNPSSDSVFVILPFGAIPGATAPTAAEVADAVWDEDATAHQTQGTFGQAIGDPGADSDTIWALANTNLNATVSSRASQTSVDTIDDFLDTEVAAILADTNELQTDWADGGRLDLILDARASQTSVDTIDDFLDTEIASIITTLGTPAGASISADILTVDNLVDDLESRLGTPSNLGGGATIAANLADIEAQTDDIGTAGAGLTAVPWNAAWDAEVQSEVDDAIVARNLDKLILASGTSDSGSTSTMVDAARTEADTDYWKGMLIVFTSGNIIGQARIITAFDAATDTITFAPVTTQAVSTQTYIILSVGDFLRPTTSGRTLDVSSGGEAGVDWANVGSPTTTVGLSGTTVKTATDVETDTQDIQGRLPAALVSGRMDSNMQAAANGVITASVIATDAIDADALADGAITAATFAAGAIDASAIAADAIGSSELAASAVTEIQSGLSTLTAAQVNAEVVDALATDTYAEPGQGTPAATLSLAAKINYLFKAWRNKSTQTSTTYSLFADDGSTVDQKATVSDDATTFTKGEVATGP